MRFRARLLPAFSMTLVLLLAGACGDSDDNNGVDSSTRDDVTSIINGALPSDGPPEPGGTLTVTDPSDATTLDVQATSGGYTHSGLSGIVYSKLVKYDARRDLKYGSGAITGDLAEKWSNSPDGLTWTFNLRKGVKWQNIAPVNGREFTSADVVCTVARSQTMTGSPSKGVTSRIQNTATPDQYTVVFTLKAPFATFDEAMANPFMEIVPCEGTRGEFDMATTAIGTGPFTLQKWERKVQRTYLKNPNYFIPGQPYLDQLNIVIIPDPTAQLAAFRTGQVDLIGLSTEQPVPQILESNPDAVIRAQTLLTSNQIMMNQANKPFDDLRVRKAIALAWDRTEMLKLDYSVFTLGGPYPKTLPGSLSDEEVDEAYPFDPTEAKKLLAEAGYPDGFSVEMLTTDGTGTTLTKEAQWIQEDMKKVGITITLKIVDYATMIATLSSKQYTLAWSYTSNYPTADEWLQSYYLSGSPRNWYNTSDPALDKMIQEQAGIVDDAKREEALHDISLYIADKIANPLMGGQASVPSVMQTWVHNLYEVPGSREYVVQAWLDKDAPGRK